MEKAILDKQETTNKVLHKSIGIFLFSWHFLNMNLILEDLNFCCVFQILKSEKTKSYKFEQHMEFSKAILPSDVKQEQLHAS